MASVFAASDADQRPVALKLLHSPLAADETIRARFVREGYAANLVEHPGVARVLADGVEANGDAFLVLELFEGETLEARWQRQPNKRLPVAEALAYADQVLDVLETAHARGGIHRDVKPENVRVTTGGALKGLACARARARAQPHLTQFGAPQG